MVRLVLLSVGANNWLLSGPTVSWDSSVWLVTLLRALWSRNAFRKRDSARNCLILSSLKCSGTEIMSFGVSQPWCSLWVTLFHFTLFHVSSSRIVLMKPELSICWFEQLMPLGSVYPIPRVLLLWLLLRQWTLWVVSWLGKCQRTDGQTFLTYLGDY